jgi:hypothetical protein
MAKQPEDQTPTVKYRPTSGKRLARAAAIVGTPLAGFLGGYMVGTAQMHDDFDRREQTTHPITPAQAAANALAQEQSKRTMSPDEEVRVVLGAVDKAKQDDQAISNQNWRDANQWQQPKGALIGAGAGLAGSTGLVAASSIVGAVKRRRKQPFEGRETVIDFKGGSAIERLVISDKMRDITLHVRQPGHNAYVIKDQLDRIDGVKMDVFSSSLYIGREDYARFSHGEMLKKIMHSLMQQDLITESDELGVKATTDAIAAHWDIQDIQARAQSLHR